MVGKNRIRRRDVLKTTGRLLGGFAIAGAVATPATAQPTYFRYDRVRVQLINIESVPPRFLSVESPLYLTQALLSECDTGHPCSIQILAYQRTDDGDDDDDQGDDADDTGADDDQDDDDDGSCPGFASVTLLCHAESRSDAVVMTGLIRNVLTQYADQGVDFAISLTPSTATNINTPRQVSMTNPCRSDDSDGDDDGDGGQDDDGDDNGDDNGDGDDDGGQDAGDDTGDDDGGGDDN